jgi:hypothetical protein
MSFMCRLVRGRRMGTVCFVWLLGSWCKDVQTDTARPVEEAEEG